MLWQILLDPEFNPGEHHIFGIRFYTMAVLVTDELKVALEAKGLTGLSYLPVG